MSLFGGIIRDTFAALREDAMKRIECMCSKAFISGLDRKQIGDELWTRIAERDQPVWNYVLFVWYLWENEKHRWHQDDELEAFVLECVKASDPKWLPMGRAVPPGTTAARLRRSRSRSHSSRRPSRRSSSSRASESVFCRVGLLQCARSAGVRVRGLGWR